MNTLSSAAVTLLGAALIVVAAVVSRGEGSDLQQAAFGPGCAIVIFAAALAVFGAIQGAFDSLGRRLLPPAGLLLLASGVMIVAAQFTASRPAYNAAFALSLGWTLAAMGLLLCVAGVMLLFDRSAPAGGGSPWRGALRISTALAPLLTLAGVIVIASLALAALEANIALAVNLAYVLGVLLAGAGCLLAAIDTYLGQFKKDAA